MEAVIRTRGLARRFGRLMAVDGVDLQVGKGAIVGLIGPNGAGKTTLLRCLLGLSACKGEVEVLGGCPRRDRARLMEQACFMADTAILPRWMRVDQLLEIVAGLHPNFDRHRAETLLADTGINLRSLVRHLSKGMVVQLHLSVVMAIDARLLVLDEPTLGLDILFRKRFYQQLLEDYFDGERTIVISTHQVDEVEQILTDVLFMQRGRLVLQQSMAAIGEEFVELRVPADHVGRAAGIPHLGSRTIPGGKAFVYQGIPRESLAPLGQVTAPSLSDLFVAVMGEGTHGG